MIDQTRLQAFTATLQTYKAGKASLERRVVAAENWWKLRNRFLESRPGDDPDEFKSVSGWLHNVIVSKHADAMDAYPEPVILPREPGDQDEARMLSAIVPCILEQNRFEKVYDHAMWQKLKTGTAAYRVVWDNEKLGGMGDIAIERVDLLNLFWEPGVDDIQKSRFVFHTHLESEEDLAEKYPQLKGRMKSSAFRATRFVYDDAVDLSGKQTVIEVYYKKRGVLHYCKYVGDTVLYATEDDPLLRYTSPFCHSDASPLCHSERSEESPTSDIGDPSSGAALLRMTGGEGKGLYAHGRYPFVLDPLFPVEGSPCGYGFVDLCHNTQTAIDLMRSAFVKNTMVGATPRYFQRIDGSVNEEEFADLGRAMVHVSGNLGEDSLRQITFNPLSGVYLSVLESEIAELRETSGNTETATGVVHSGVTAASAIAALQEASGKGSRDASRASYLAYAEIVELVIELIREFYTLPRCFRITGELGAEEFVSYGNAGLLPRPMWDIPAAAPFCYSDASPFCHSEERSDEESPSPDGRRSFAALRMTDGRGMTGGEGVPAPAPYYRLPVFDVKVSAQKRSAYSRLSQNELAIQLYQLGLFEPGREQQALLCLDMMEFDGKDALRQRLSGESEGDKYKALALALARRYRPDMALGLMGFDPPAAAASPSCHSEERSDEESPSPDGRRSFAALRMTGGEGMPSTTHARRHAAEVTLP